MESVKNIRQLLLNKQRDCAKTREQYEAFVHAQKESEKHLNTLKSRRNTRLSSIKREMFDEYKNNLVKSEKDAIEEIKDAINDLKIDKQNKISSVEQECVPNDDLLEKLEEEQNLLNNSIKRVYGADFVKLLVNRSDMNNFTISSDEISDFIDLFNKINARLEKKRSVQLEVNRVVNFSPKLLDSTTNMFVFAVIFFILTLFFAYYVTPFYIIFLTYMAVKNIMTGLEFHSAVTLLDCLRDNLEEIEKQVKLKFEEEKLNKIRIIDEKFKIKMETMKDELSKYETLLSTKIFSAEKSFSVDEDDIMREYDSDVKLLEIELENKNKELEQTRRLIEQLDNDINDLHRKLEDELRLLPTRYMCSDNAGESYDFKTDYLIDVSPDNITMFKHPERSCIFVYRDIELVYDFIKLLCVQMRSSMNPFLFNITVHDIVYAGANLQPLIVNDNEALFKIITDKTKSVDTWTDTDFSVVKKSRLVKSNAINLKQYNNIMVETGSVVEMYNIIFCIDPEISVFQHPGYRKSIMTSKDLGIFVHSFVHVDFLKSNYKNKDIFNDNVSIYIIDRNNVIEKRLDYFIKLYGK